MFVLRRELARPVSMMNGVVTVNSETTAEDEMFDRELKVNYRLKNLWKSALLSDMCVAVVGLNGGAASAVISMLIRSGFRHLILFNDTKPVSLCDLASMGYLPEQVGMNTLQIHRLMGR